MHSGIVRSGVIAASLAALLVPAAPMHAQNAPALPDILKAAGEYLVQYSRQLGAVAADEEWVQTDTSSGQMAVPKRVESEFVLLGGGNGTFAEFRDVVAIDKAPVHPADGRLLALFKAPSRATLPGAQQMTQDALRYYLSGNLHALDQPALALVYFQAENQSHSTFKLDGVKKMDGRLTATVRFSEQGTPRLIPSGIDGGGVGRAWIDTETGAIRQTELGISSKSASASVNVKYVTDKTTGLWLPSEMYQQIRVSDSGTGEASTMGGGAGYGSSASMEGRASYAKFRQVPVDLGKLK
jgi:hypothetical protein